MSPTTPIGQGLRLAPWRLALACLLGFMALEVDWLLSMRRHYLFGARGHDPHRYWLILAVLPLFFLVQGDRHSLGLTLRPIQGWRHWGMWSVAAATLIGLFCAFVLAIVHLLGMRLHIPAFPLEQFPEHFLFSCVKIPLLEEAIYRILFCVPAVVLIGERGAIVANGLVFALLHIMYENPSPDNQIAGFIFAYAYLKSGSILVPLALHAIGNSFGLIFLMTAWEMGYRS